MHTSGPKFVVRLNQDVPQRTVLPIAEAGPESGTLIGPGGDPVWPIAGSAQAETLGRVVRLFGGTAEVVPARPGGLAPERASGTVIGIGDLVAEAELYAHLTGRRAGVVEDLNDLSPSSLPDILLYCGLFLDRHLIEVLQLAEPAGEPVGIIWGRSREELRMQVLSCSCAAYLNGPTAVPDLYISHLGLGDGAEGGESVETLRRRIGEGVGILRLHGHSDGLYQELGHGSVLCVRGEDPEPGDPETAPRCLAADHCDRLKTPFDKALREGRLVPPTAISARIFIHLSCHSAFLGCAPIDPAWGFLPGLAANPNIGALVTTPSLAFTHDVVLENELGQYLRSGAAVGDAVARLQENPTIKEIGYKPLLFGDPRVRGGPSSHRAAIMRDAASRQPVSAAPTPALLGATDESATDIELIRGMTGPLAVISAAANETADEVRRRLVAYEDATGGELEAEELAVQIAVLRHLANTRVRLWQGWVASSHTEQLDDPEPCPNCSWTGKPRFVTLPSGGEREFIDCPSCSEVLDRPVEEPGLELSFDPLVFRLDSEVDRARSVAAVFVLRTAQNETRTIGWPLDDDGRPLPEMPLDLTNLRPGPVFIYGVLMKGLSLHSRTFRTRGLGSEDSPEEMRAAETVGLA